MEGFEQELYDWLVRQSSSTLSGEDEVKSTYKTWLQQRGHAAPTVQAQLHRAGRIEKLYGDLDQHDDQDEFRSVTEELKYSAADERSNKPNPSRIQIEGNILENLYSYRSAIAQYCKSRRETRDEDVSDLADDRGQLVSLDYRPPCVAPSTSLSRA